MSQNGKLATDLVQKLERDIVTGVLKPGDKLDERSLSERFGVSRTPVREALQTLAGSGLVATMPRRGTIVASITVAELIEMFEVMAELEAMCARLAARRMPRVDIENLIALSEECNGLKDHADADAYYEANVRFHEAIYAGCRNSFLERQTKNVRNRLAPYRRLQLHRPGRVKKSNNEHADILSAISNGEAETAGKLMQQHVAVQGESLNDLLAIVPRGYLEPLAS
ncbi:MULTISPECIES: GntR family transcriptional regulator [Thalassospira]|jgi:DNA-binding GntR family transcriptional regulator|uniref:AsnC family transcriptional regulator n=2 Tax=Thalassospira tepidiphila TaxID=393657 RepID=A0A853L0Z3_9PROT|nr:MULTISPECIES: GntR family transcriptional regulator [Thalassospira]KXJ53006.1 MAG: AsnC family transcriptional regulator [Thalassospira sp. Nap_22]EKF07198.1 GntR family transcriptional regulator [Thalassospira profundimaris WP0211]KZD00654.1 AsnC family transcriptional regulator [Thalassospira sp. MCCC 1A02898]MBO6579939.1 GntR family transcriptional regulator [Thalassospira sp.]MBO6802919.1 GntR family transcriptional regulator [Thalassospira sp.]